MTDTRKTTSAALRQSTSPRAVDDAIEAGATTSTVNEIEALKARQEREADWKADLERHKAALDAKIAAADALIETETQNNEAQARKAAGLLAAALLDKGKWAARRQEEERIAAEKAPAPSQHTQASR